MRSFSANATSIPVPPDTRITLLLAATVAQEIDYPTGTQVVRLTGLSSAGAQYNFYVNLHSSAAALPTSGSTATTGSTGISVPVLGMREFSVFTSTGLSVIAPTSGYVHIECWRR